jgi:hypothetical protein
MACEAVKITSKAEFYRLWEAGALGNRTQLFYTLEEALASGVPTIGFRMAVKGGGGAWEKGSRDEAPLIHARWIAAGRTFVMDGSVPNDQTLVQGEVCRAFRGLESYLVVGGPGLPPMRQTMAAGLHRSYGPTATRAILERWMDPSSQDDLYALLELYPDATIEFACFAVDVGVIPNRNTIFWETRDY